MLDYNYEVAYRPSFIAYSTIHCVRGELDRCLSIAEPTRALSSLLERNAKEWIQSFEPMPRVFKFYSCLSHRSAAHTKFLPARLQYRPSQTPPPSVLHPHPPTTSVKESPKVPSATIKKQFPQSHCRESPAPRIHRYSCAYPPACQRSQSARKRCPPTILDGQIRTGLKRHLRGLRSPWIRSLHRTRTPRLEIRRANWPSNLLCRLLDSHCHQTVPPHRILIQQHWKSYPHQVIESRLQPFQASRYHNIMVPQPQWSRVSSDCSPISLGEILNWRLQTKVQIHRA